MPLHRSIVGTSAAALMILAGIASGQSFPNKPIRIVTGGVGGSTDFTSRVIAQILTGELGQQVIVDNRAGSVVIPEEIVAKSLPDGHTLLLYGSALWLLPFMMKDNVPYDPLKDLAPVTLATSSPTILVVHPSVPVKTVSELIALAKAQPGALNYASGGAGTSSHLAMELFKSMAGVSIVRVPYKNSGVAINDTLGGQVQLIFSPTAAATQHIKSGRLRALGVTSAQPSALAPGLPTVAASLPDYEATALYGIFVPAGTPEPIIDRLNRAIARVLGRADAKQRLLNTGVEAVGSTAEQLAVKVKAEMSRMGRVIRDVGIREE